MLSSPSTRPANTDLSFFSGPRTATRHASACRPATVVVRRVQTKVNTTSSSPSPLSPRKRKAPTSEHVALPKNVKRLRPSPSSPVPKPRHKSRSKRSSTPSTRLSSPEPVYLHDKSRSTSRLPGTPNRVLEEPARVKEPRRCWIDDNGNPGPGFISSEQVVKKLMRSYKQFFRNLEDPLDSSFEPHPINYPVAEIEYPNNGATERFILLAPKDKDHYNPIMCLEKTLYTIIECYLTPAQQSLFGTIPTDILTDVVTPPPSPSPSPQSSPLSTPPNSQDSKSSSLTSLSSTSSNTSRVNYLRALQRSIHRQDGRLFLKTVNTINNLLRSLKYPPFPTDLDPFAPGPPNVLMEAPKTWSDLPQKVLMRIIDETYQRCVGPHVAKLRNYEAFSSEVYGELMPSFTSDIINNTNLGPSSLFLDLGSGVGNVALQVSLQTGCRSFGVEIMKAPADVARTQLDMLRRRCRMWGVACGGIELEEGDMLESRRVSELMKEADVVLVNNKVFLESLNEALKPKFLDLKEGAIVVSLKPFVSSLNARVTERNVDEISTIFQVDTYPYHSGNVSWGSNGGNYYLQRVDRDGYAIIRDKFESSRMGGRTTRSRR